MSKCLLKTFCFFLSFASAQANRRTCGSHHVHLSAHVHLPACLCRSVFTNPCLSVSACLSVSLYLDRWRISSRAMSGYVARSYRCTGVPLSTSPSLFSICCGRRKVRSFDFYRPNHVTKVDVWGLTTPTPLRHAEKEIINERKEHLRRKREKERDKRKLPFFFPHFDSRLLTKTSTTCEFF